MQPTYTLSSTEQELQGILTLQAKNLKTTISEEESNAQGFLTVQHSFDLLKKLNDTEKHIIAKVDDLVAGYVLSMTKHAKNDIPLLVPMFEVFDKTVYQNKTISEYNYITVGQACVDKAFRGQGILENCYKTFKAYHQDKYDFAITEIAQNNHRSLAAHKRIGFSELTTYHDGNMTWIVVIWDWRNSK